MEFFTHEYFLILYGLFLWHLVRWYRALKKTKKRSFSNKEWWKNEKNDVLISLAFAPLLVVFDDELLNLYASYFLHENSIDLSRYPWIYLLSGFAIDRILYFAFRTKAL
ncbi:MAG: hypothetical protein ABJG78_15020 [Cyclobacteriaceae bacterium]